MNIYTSIRYIYTHSSINSSLPQEATISYKNQQNSINTIIKKICKKFFYKEDSFNGSRIKKLHGRFSS